MYLLDTNICIYIINKRPQSVMSIFETMNAHEVKLSSVTLAEMEYGASKSKYRERNRRALLSFVSPFEIVPFDDSDAEIFGLIRADLEYRGTLIGSYDMQIAAQALNRSYALVTNNIEVFSRIRELKLENWVTWESKQYTPNRGRAFATMDARNTRIC
jgi:tRNA(fMet)-specific endonuclease VapC